MQVWVTKFSVLRIPRKIVTGQVSTASFTYHIFWQKNSVKTDDYKFLEFQEIMVLSLAHYVSQWQLVHNLYIVFVASGASRLALNNCIKWNCDLYYYGINSGCPAVREKSGKFQTWQKSGNFDEGQGKNEYWEKSGNLHLVQSK